MKSKLNLFLLSIVCIGAIVYLISQTSAANNRISELSEKNNVLRDFQTVTVEVTFPSSTQKTVLGYDENSLSNLALEKVCTRLTKKFPSREIACGRYGMPHTFQTNPLNLSIIFEAKNIRGSKDQYNIHATFERSDYFSLLSAPENPTLKKKFNEMVQSRNGDYFLSPAIKRDFITSERYHLASGYIQDKAALEGKIEFLSSLIVIAMQPDEGNAKEQEFNLLKNIN